MWKIWQMGPMGTSEGPPWVTPETLDRVVLHQDQDAPTESSAWLSSAAGSPKDSGCNIISGLYRAHLHRDFHMTAIKTAQQVL